MTITPISFVPGVNADDTTYSAKPQWVSTEGCRFHMGGIEGLGGYVRLCDQTVRGVPRAVETWADVDGNALMGIGTHTGLAVLNGGLVFDVTPLRDGGTLATDPFATFAGQTTVVVTHAGHGLSDGDQVHLSGASAVGGITIGGAVTSVASPFTTIAGMATVIVNWPSHGRAQGDLIAISSASAVGGITPNGIYTVSRIDADVLAIQHSTPATSGASGGGSPLITYYQRYTATVISASAYSIEVAAPATSTATGGGSGVAYFYEMPVGNQDGGPASGYGSGGYGEGGYGLSAAVEAYPMTWSLVPFGQDLLANARGRGVYVWQPATQARAVLISEAPAKVTAMFRTAEKIAVALGCEYEGDYDPMLVRHSDIDNYLKWAPDVDNAARFQRLTVGSRLIAGRPSAGENLLWTDIALYAMRYLADPDQVYGYYLLGEGCGLIGPNAAAVKDGAAFWMANNGQFYTYAGGTPQSLPCTVISQSFGLLADGQAEKVYCWINSRFNEVVWGIPGPSGEIDCEVAYNIDDQTWAPNRRTRTCAVDSPLFGGPVMLDQDGAIWNHEIGYTANGGPLSGSARTSPIDIASGAAIMDIFGLIPDFQFGDDPSTAVDLYLITADYQGAPETVEGPYTVRPGVQVFDTRVEGRRAALELRWSTTGAWRTRSQIRLDIQPSGRRR